MARLCALLLLCAACGSTQLLSETPPPPAAQAADAPAPRPEIRREDGIALEEAIQLAMEQNPRLLTVRRGLQLGEAQRLTAAQWPFNPVLTLEGNRALPWTEPDDNNLGVGVSQEFEVGGQRRRRSAVAAANLESVHASIANEERLLKTEVASAFYEVLALDAQKALAGENVEIAGNLLAAASARFDAKQIAEVDLNLVRLQTEQAHNESARIDARGRTARLKLAALIGEPAGAELSFTGTLGAPPLEIEHGQAVRFALDHRPDVAARRHAVRTAEREIELEESLVTPNPELGVFFSNEYGLIEGLSDRDRLLGFEIRLPLPVFNRRKGEIAEARAREGIAVAELADLGRQVEREVEVALEQLRIARDTVRLYEEQLNPLSRKNLDQFEIAYRAGEVGTLEVLRAQEDRNRVARGYQEALLEYNAARIEIESALGGEIPK